MIPPDLKHRCFFPYAQSVKAKALTYAAVVGNIMFAVTAAYTWVRPGSLGVNDHNEVHTYGIMTK